MLQVDGGRIIGLKRCDGNPLYVRREVIVHSLRLLFGMKDYPVKMMAGIRLRAISGEANCAPLQGWESSDFVMVDFGVENMRKNFSQLHPQDIQNPSAFFEQYGEWCAFNYIIGAKDRHAGNFIYDVGEGNVYSIDNEERPFDANRRFAPFDSEIGNFQNNVRGFLPPDPNARQDVIVGFKRAFLDRWSRIQGIFATMDLVMDSGLGAEIDLLHIRAVLEQVQSVTVLGKISLQ